MLNIIYINGFYRIALLNEDTNEIETIYNVFYARIEDAKTSIANHYCTIYG